MCVFTLKNIACDYGNEKDLKCFNHIRLIVSAVADIRSKKILFFLQSYIVAINNKSLYGGSQILLITYFVIFWKLFVPNFLLHQFYYWGSWNFFLFIFSLVPTWFHKLKLLISDVLWFYSHFCTISSVYTTCTQHKYDVDWLNY